MAKDIAMTKKNKKNSFLEWAESTDRQIYRETDDYVRSLRALYDDAIDAMDGKIYKYLAQIADEDGTSLAEAKRWLSGEERRAFQMSLEEFKRKSIAAIGDSALDKEVRQMSRRARISYLQAIQLSLKTELAKLMDTEEKRLFNHLRESYETKYYHELYGMARMTAPEPIQKVNGEAINRLIGRHWHVDGKDLSDRLSARSKNTIALLEREIGQNLAMGKSQDEVIRTVAKNMNRSFRGAATLVQTETASILTQAAKDSYTRYGLEEYQLSATLDLKTSEICQEMDRKHFPVKDMQQGINAPPFHPNCRTAIMPYFGDDLQKRMKAEVGRMARDPVTGKSVRVGDLSYKEWYNKYVQESPENPFAGRPNRYVVDKIARGEYGTVINNEKQKPHMESTAGTDKSFLGDRVDPQELFNTYAGTGIMELDRNGNYTNKEICMCKYIIGVDRQSNSETNMIKIHHSKKRTHIVPYFKRRK